MAELINTGEGGLDSSTSKSKVSAKHLIEAWNISLNDDGKVDEISSLSGTIKKAGITIGTNFRVLGGVDSYGYTDYNCTGSFNRVEGVVAVFYDDETKGRIVFYDIVNDMLSVLYESLPLSRLDDVDMVSYNDRDIATVYMVNENMPYTMIDIRCYGEACRIPLTQKDISARPITEYDVLIVEDVLPGGAIPAGKIAFSFRYVSTTKNRTTKWSPPTPVIPIYMDVGGGYPGQLTDKKVVLRLNALVGFSGFDKIQLAVIKYQDGITAAPLVARVLPSFDPSPTFEYTGVGLNEVEIPVGEVVIDDMALLSARTIAQEDNRNFLGAYRLNGFEEDNGKVVIQDAFTIRQRILEGERGHYGDFSDDINKRGYFRGELYAFGACYEDDYGNSVVYPLDMSPFGRNLVIGTVAGTVVSSDPIIPETILTTGSPGDPWRVGDFVRIDGVVMEVVQTMTDFMLFQIAVNAVVTGPIVTIERLRGQVGNQAESWAYKFASREDNQFSLLGLDGDPEALGLSIIGLRNHPSWATRVRIVRRERVRDILYQTIHVPVVPFRGLPTSLIFDEVNNGSGIFGDEFIAVIDYDGELDTLMPKHHYLGVARNTSYLNDQWILAVGEYNYFKIYNANTTSATSSEAPKHALLLPPEFLYNKDEEAFRPEVLANATAKVVDGVYFTAKHFYEELQKDYDIVKEWTQLPIPYDYSFNSRCILFDAAARHKYFTTREGQIDILGARRRMRLTALMDRLNLPRDAKIRWQLPVINGQERQTLIDNNYGYGPYNEIKYYGGAGRLAFQQGTHPSIPDFFREMFLPKEQNVRGILVSLDETIFDFTFLAFRLKLEEQGDLFPYGDYYIPPLTTEELPRGHLHKTIPGVGDRPNAYCAAYILNICAGLGDDRYGNITDQSEWIDVGNTVRPLTPAMIAANIPLNFEVWGGDCYINKHMIKANQSSPQAVAFRPFVDQLGPTDDPGLALGHVFAFDGQKTGAQNLSEVMEVWMESEVNATNEVKDKSLYPYKDNIAALKKYYLHRYNGSYSAENNSKIFVSPDQIYKSGTVFDPAFTWTDRRVRGAIFNDLLDLDGSRRIRVNNMNMLSGENGLLRKLLSMGAKDLYAIQEDAIRYFPVGIDELQTTDSVVISTGTGKLLGAGAYDLYSKFGIQSLHHITKMNGLIYGFDAKRATAYVFGVRGEGFSDLSDKGEKEYMRLLTEMPDLRVYGEMQFGRFVIHSSNGQGLVFKRVKNLYETRLRTPRIDFGIGTQDKLLLVKDGSFYEAYGDPRPVFFGEEVVPEFMVSVNASSDVTKVFQVVEANSSERMLDMRAIIALEQENMAIAQDTGWITLDTKPRNRLYYQNLLRSPEGGRLKKMIGLFMLLQFRMKSDKKTSIRNIKTLFRKSY